MDNGNLPPGSRVIALREANKDSNEVSLIGSGVYVGDFDVPEHYSSILPASAMQQPKIELDDGTVIWGFECWWGPEDRIKAEFALDSPDTNIIHFDAVRARAEALIANTKSDNTEKVKFKADALPTGLMDYALQGRGLVNFAKIKFGALPR